ncbi:MAG: hypothetical protein QM731_02725 [Chitinophagaceae bacterium]
MPKQNGVVKKERRIGILIFYKMRDKYYVRALSSLSSERVKTGKEFKKTMIYANRMVIASRLAASIYRQLPPAWKEHSIYRKLTGYAMQLLKEDRDATDILRKLPELLYELGYRSDVNYEIVEKSGDENPEIRRRKARIEKFEIRRRKTRSKKFEIRIKETLNSKIEIRNRRPVARSRAPDSIINDQRIQL